MSGDTNDPWADHETGVSPEQIEDAREVAGQEQVVCQECARAFGQITDQHLRIHGTTLEEYQTEYPDAPIYPNVPSRQPGRDPGFSHPEETRRKISESTKENHERGVYE